MTKAQWISTIQNTMMKIDEQGIYRAPLIEKHIQSVYEQMYNELYKAAPRHFSQYTTTVSEILSTQTVLTEPDGRTIVTIPISLPRENGGLFGMYIGDSEVVLTSYEGYRNVTQSSFDTAGFMGKYVGTLLNDTIYVNTTVASESNINIKYRMIPKFTEFASTDEVKIPMGQEDHFIDRVIDTIRHMTPSDLINDNTV